MSAWIGLLFSALLVATAAQAQEWLYTVRPGDNIWNITADYLTSMSYWPKLQALNRVADPERLPPGMKLRIPVAWLKSQPTAARVLSARGEVEVTLAFNNRTITAATDQPLQSGDEIRTGPDGSATLEFGDGSRLLLQAGSRLVMDTLSVYGDTRMVDTRLRLRQGRADNQVTPRQAPRARYEIWTPAATTAVRGTNFRLGMDAATGVARVEVLAGALDLKGERQSRAVSKGFGSLAETGRPPAAAARLLAAPTLADLPPQVERVPVRFGFPALSGAAGYRAQIAANARFETLLFDGVSQQPQVRGPDLPDGDYVVRVRGIDAQGLEGYDAYHSFQLRARPEPPFLARPGPGATVPEKAPTFEWTEPAAAASYHLQLAEDERFASVLLDLPDYASTRLTPDQTLAPGVYYWRVATRDSAGRQGPFGDPQRFRLLPIPKVGPPEAVEGEMVFRWSAALPGQRYQIQLAKDSNFQDIVVDRQVDEPQLAIPWPESGFNYLRMRTIDPDGTAAPYGPTQRIDLPPKNYWPFALGAVLVLILAL
ncbi:MAG: FecR domain-containing protein [Candidatus Competibacter sp.]|nr:FecR domain-containing protein [Candidatus Competibacter sp.]